MPLHLKELVYLYRNTFDLFKDDFQKMPFWQFKHFLDIMKVRTLDNAYIYMVSEYCNRDSNKDKPIIWMYWENKAGHIMSELNRACLETIIKYNRQDFQIKILGDIDIPTYLPNINQNYKKYSQIAHKADYIRFNLLYEYGGIWLDLDTVIFRSLDEVKEKISKYGFVANAYLDENQKYFPLIGFLGAKKHNEICKIIIEKTNEKLNTSSTDATVEQEWDCIGFMLADILNSKSYDNYIYSIDYFCPYPIYEKSLYNYTGTNFKDFINKINPQAFGQSIANSVYNEIFQKMNRKEILENNSFIGHVLRIALANYDYYANDYAKVPFAKNPIWKLVYRLFIRPILKIKYGKKIVKNKYDKIFAK